MGAITIRNLDDSVVSAIKRKAAEHGVSMEEEVRTLLASTYSEDRQRRSAGMGGAAARATARAENCRMPRPVPSRRSARCEKNANSNSWTASSRAAVNLVVDASVAFKWLVNEDDSDAALAAACGAQPSLLPTCCSLNAATRLLNKRRRRGKLDGRRGANSLSVHFDELQIRDNARHACFCHTHLRSRWRLGDPIYDCIYLAAAIATDRMLVTADERFAAAS